MNPRLVAVVNPTSAGGRTGKKWTRTMVELVRQFGRFEVWETEHAGAGRALGIKAAAAEFGRVLIVGGDGTLSEVVDGLLANGAWDGHVVYIPSGTGQDFARTPKDSGRVDVMRVLFSTPAGKQAARHAMNCVSIGVSGHVDSVVARYKKSLPGPLAFAAATLNGLWSHRPFHSEVRLNAAKQAASFAETTVISVSNGQYFGAGMRIAPQASLSDGLAEVVVLNRMGIEDFVMRAHRLYQGTHLSLPGCTHFQCTDCEIDAVAQIDLDGEWVGHGPMRVEVLPQRLQLDVFKNS